MSLRARTALRARKIGFQFGREPKCHFGREPPFVRGRLGFSSAENRSASGCSVRARPEVYAGKDGYSPDEGLQCNIVG